MKKLILAIICAFFLPLRPAQQAAHREVNAGLRDRNFIARPNEVLIEAAKTGDVSIAFLCMLFGAYIDSVDLNGRTALMYAIEGGHRDVVQDLLDAGADLCTEDNDGYNVVDFALRSGDRPIKLMLLRAILKRLVTVVATYILPIYAAGNFG